MALRMIKWGILANFRIAFLCFLITTASPGHTATSEESEAPTNCAQAWNLNTAPHSLGYQILSTLDRALPHARPWELTSAEAASIEGIFANKELEPIQQLTQLYNVLISARLRGMNSLSRFLARAQARDATRQHSIYARTLGRVVAQLIGPHYNPLINRNAMTIEDAVEFPGVRELIAIHEAEHGFHRNTNPIPFALAAFFRSYEMFMLLPTPFSPALIRTLEDRTVGAQWELVSRIPQELRKDLLATYEAKYLQATITPELQAEVAAVVLSGLHRKVHQWLSELTTVAPFSGDLKRAELDMLSYGIHSYELRDALITLAKRTLTPSDARVFADLARGGRGSRLGAAWIKRSYSRWLTVIQDQKQSFIEFSTDQDFDTYQTLIQRTLETRPVSKERFEWQEPYERLFYFSLRHADLTKEAFIQVVSTFHGYSIDRLYANHYQFGKFKLRLLALGLIGLVYFKTPELFMDTQVYSNLFYWVFR